MDNSNNKKRLARLSEDRWIAGVCAGIADYFGWDVATVRIAYLLLSCCTASSGVPVYIILWICMPEE